MHAVSVSSVRLPVPDVVGAIHENGSDEAGRLILCKQAFFEFDFGVFVVVNFSTEAIQDQRIGIDLSVSDEVASLIVTHCQLMIFSHFCELVLIEVVFYSKRTEFSPSFEDFGWDVGRGKVEDGCLQLLKLDLLGQRYLPIIHFIDQKV